MAELTSREYEAQHFSIHGNLPLQIATGRMRNAAAEQTFRPLLRTGHRLRATRAECCAREASFAFSHWDGGWIVSKSGRFIAPGSVYSVEGVVFRFESDFVGPMHPTIRHPHASRRLRPLPVVLDEVDDGEIPF